MNTLSILLVTTILVLACCQCSFARNKSVGVCLGLNSDKLPPINKTVEFYQQCGIKTMRLFEPRAEILQALSGSGICLTLGTRNEDLKPLGTSQEAANQWIGQNVAPYNKTCFYAITLGNEAIKGPYAFFIPQAMTNIHNALVTLGRRNILVSTVIHATTLGISYPPSAGMFLPKVANLLSQVATIAGNLNSPVMINVYPYYAYVSDVADIPLDYVMFNSSKPVVVDGQYKYYNIFDAMVDAFYAAFEKLGFPNVTLYVTESGWPSSENEPYTSPGNAQKYNHNFERHISQRKGTPRRPEKPLEAFLFALFNEDLKRAGIEQHWGLLNTDLTPVYPFC